MPVMFPSSSIEKSNLKNDIYSRKYKQTMKVAVTLSSVTKR